MAGLLIVDDHAAVRAGLVALFAPEPGLVVLGAAGDAGSALARTRELGPDLVLVDLHLPGEDGLGLSLRLVEERDPPRRVIYSAFADDALGVLAAVAGADAVVDKSAHPVELLDTVRAVAAGRDRRPAPRPPALHTVGAALEEADLPILGMLVHGVAPAEVAATLGLTDVQLRARRRAMLGRLRTRRDRREALLA